MRSQPRRGLPSLPLSSSLSEGSMNLTNTTLEAANNFRPCRIWTQEYFVQNMIFSVLSITLNLVTLPFVIVMNSLIIIAIKTRRRLQTMYNIMLASLAGTDLVVGIMSQPIFVAQEIFLLTGPPLTEYCHIYRMTISVYLSPTTTSLIQLAILSVERFIAMKYSLKYDSIVTSTRLTVLIVFSWLIPTGQIIARYANSTFLRVITFYFSLSVVFLSIIVITYCHIVVYFVSRRHMKQIKSELYSREDTVKFLKEKKALITTTIIIGFVFVSYIPGSFFSIVRYILPRGYYTLKLTAPLPPFSTTCILINSFFNPVIYCWRNKELRTAFFEVLRRRNGHV